MRRCTLDDLNAVLPGARERATFGAGAPGAPTSQEGGSAAVTFAVPPPFPAWTWERDGTVLGCGGAFVTEERAECWLWLSDAARARPFTLVRFARDFLDMVRVLFPGRTLALWVPAGDDGAARFAGALGFVDSGATRTLGRVAARRWDLPIKESRVVPSAPGADSLREPGDATRGIG